MNSPVTEVIYTKVRPRKHCGPNLFGDPPNSVDLAPLENNLGAIADARTAIVHAIDDHIARCFKVKSPGLKRLLDAHPAQDKILFLQQIVRFRCDQTDTASEALNAMDECQVAISSADKFLSEFLRSPSMPFGKMNVAGVARSMHGALLRLNTALKIQ
jgi:hypothetical protein